MKWTFPSITILVVALLVSACSSTPDKEATEQELYEDARRAIKLRNFNQATIALEELESRFPFGKYAEQAQLDLVYARYSSLDLDGAILAAERFIRLHPQSPNVDYAYYLKGIANYHLDLGVASQYFPMVEESARDPGHMRTAFDDFKELVERFPESRYAADARQRMLQIRNRLAEYELHVARYYVRREAYLAAANRAAYVVKHFPNSPSVEDALIMMVELYELLQLDNQASDALAVLAANFPEGKAFDANMRFKPQLIEKHRRSLKSVVTYGLLDE